MKKGLRRNLRGRTFYTVIRRALQKAHDRLGARIVHYSVQGNHIHLIVEADDARALGSAMRGFAVRVARGVNTKAGRRGSLFDGRYHAQVITTPRQARNALVYVLQNAKKHALEFLQLGPQCLAQSWVDPLSSAAYFDGWKPSCQRYVPPPEPGEAPCTPPQSWLLTRGWRRHGLIDTAEMPKGADYPNA